MSDLISVIIPCYNQGKLLPEALNSLLEQKHQNWEAIVVNDGSPDDTHAIAQRWMAKDKRIKYVKKENGGSASARNAGLEIATGSYIQFLDADDMLHPEKFSLSLAVFQEKNVDVVLTNFQLFKNTLNNKKPPYCHLENQQINFETILLKWDVSYTIPPHCPLYKRDFIKEFRFEEKTEAKEDWIFLLYVFKKKPAIEFLNKNYALFREHEIRKTNNFDRIQKNCRIEYMFVYNWLEPEYKKLFFKRINDELIQKRIDYKYKMSSFKKLKLKLKKKFR